MVCLQAYDRAGNAAQETARIVIPAPNAAVTPLPTRTPPPAAAQTFLSITPHSAFSIPHSSFTIPTSTRAAVVSAFQSPNQQSTNLQSNNLQSSNPLFGAAALAAAAAAAAYALEQRRKRKEEEARQAAEAQEKAARRNAAEALQRIQNWLIGQHIQKQQEEQHRAMDAKIERMEKAEGAALAAAMKPPVKPQRAEQAYQAYRAGERNAEAIAADYQSRKAIQDFRAGERASYTVPPPTPTATPTPLKTPQPALPPTPPTPTGTPTPPLRAAPATSTPPKPVAAVPTIIPTVMPTPTPLPLPQATGKPWWQRAIENVKTFVQSEVQKFQTWTTIRSKYGWTPIGIFSQKELDIIADTGKDISTYVDALSPGNGQSWVRSYLLAVIVHWPAPLTSLGKKYEPLKVFTRPMGLPGMVILPRAWEEAYTNPKSMPLTHEFGHVWDARTGRISLPQGIVGGVADQLNTYIGGTVVEQSGSRFLDGSGKQFIPEEYWYGNDKSSVYQYKTYAQNSTADYLCETFNALVNNTQTFPDPKIGGWVETVIKLQAGNLAKTTNLNVPTTVPTPAPSASSITPVLSETPTPSRMPARFENCPSTSAPPLEFGGEQ